MFRKSKKLPVSNGQLYQKRTFAYSGYAAGIFGKVPKVTLLLLVGNVIANVGGIKGQHNAGRNCIHICYLHLGLYRLFITGMIISIKLEGVLDRAFKVRVL